MDEKAAMQIPTVYACVRLLAESIAALPLHLYRVLNVGEGRSGQVGYQMRRHMENTADLRHGELLGLKELAVLWWQGNRFVAHSLFQHTAWLCAVLEKSGAILVYRNRSTEAVLHHGNRRKYNQAIETQTRNMEDFIPAEVDILVLLSRHFIRVGVINIVELTAFIPVYHR